MINIFINRIIGKASGLLLLLFLFLHSSGQKTAVIHLECENKDNPGCIDEQKPSLSWQLSEVPGNLASGNAKFREVSFRNIRQIAYRVIVADDSAILRRNMGNVWDSRKVISDRSIQVRYAGAKLQAAKMYWWKVMVWDNHGNVSVWSRAAHWQVGLPEKTDWHGARWIGYDMLPDSLRTVPAVSGERNRGWDGVNDVLPLLRKEFDLHKAVGSATVYICGLGQFRLSLNGKKVGDHFLDPGWTKYDQHALYVAFDVTRQLQEGTNVLGVMLGNGFYFIPGERYRKLSDAYGDPKMICRLLIKYQDGSFEDIVSDNSWKTATGPVTGNYDFQVRD